MANRSRFSIAESSIKSYFKKSTRKAFSKEHLRLVFEENKGIWRLPILTTAEKFTDQILKTELLKKIQIPIESYVGTKEIYITEDATIFQIASSIINKSYLSHYTATFLNGLTYQIPKIIYITFEQSKKNNVDRDLEQNAIDQAFAKPQRRTMANGIYKGYTFLIHNGMFTNRSGVYTKDDLIFTNLERTLIDITVRPNYAGGVNAVLDAYRKALPKISINKLLAILQNMNFIYPYHQAIGFYLDRSGIENHKLDALRKLPMRYRFYLTYEMNETSFSNEWKIFYPKGM